MMAFDVLWMLAEQGRQAVVTLVPAAEAVFDVSLPVALAEVSITAAVLRDVVQQRVDAARGFVARRDAGWWSAVWAELTEDDAPRRLIRAVHRTLHRVLGS